MSQVSRRPLRKDIEGKIETLFLNCIALCDSPQFATDFLSDLLTPTEKVMLAKRLTIAYLLLKDYDYRTITSLLRVSTPTIGSVSRVLKQRGNGLRRIVDKLNTKRQWRQFFEELGDIALELIGTGKGANWKAGKSVLRQRKMARQSPLPSL